MNFIKEPASTYMNTNVFKSFLIGGYECADMINNRGNRVNLLAATGHDSKIAEDYALLSEVSIKTVREGICWSVVEKQPHQYDFSEVKNRILSAKKAGIQQLWDICHFGYPDGLMPSHPQFADRFAGVCKAFAELYRGLTNDPLIVTPINEISFLSWLGGEVRGTVPFAINSGFDIKYFLCRAAIKGIEAIKSVDPSAQIMTVEPLIKIHPPIGQEPCNIINDCNEGQFQAVDIITGRMCPELGGQPEYVDMVGINYYYENQWEHCGPKILWKKGDHQRMTFPQLLQEVYHRYNKPVVITETGHFGEDQCAWMEQITEECIEALDNGVDLRGMCIYPVVDRPDWDNLDHYIACGIWGYNDKKERYPEVNYVQCVKNCQAVLSAYFKEKAPQERTVLTMA